MTKAQLRAWSKKHQGRELRVWSSTNVRYLLAHGRIKAADEILGHAHAIEGTVVHGEERGRTIGFPTANLGSMIDGYIPVDGVYAGWLIDLGAAGATAGSDENASDDNSGSGNASVIPRVYDSGSSKARLRRRITLPVAGSDLHRHEADLQRRDRVSMSGWSRRTRLPTNGWTCMVTMCASNSRDSCARR